MKKKIISMLLATAMVLSLAACGAKEEPATETTTTETEEVAEETTEEVAETVDPSEIKVGMVTDIGGVNDGSFNQSSWEGLQKAGEDLGIQVKYLESKQDADYTPNIETFVDEEYDLIICVGFMLADATRAAAEAYPDQKFAILDDASIDLPNVTCLMFEQAQGAYLAGVVAAMATETDKVGFVLGMASDNMNMFGYGYVAGVLDTNPDAVVFQNNANSFGDLAAGKSAAVSMITEGADVIFHAAGGTGLGVIEGCKENSTYVIGVDSDQSALAPEFMLTSAMKRVDNACYDAAKATLEGTLESGIITSDLTTGGIDIAPTDTLLTDEIKAAVAEAKEKILSGEIKVLATQAEFEAKYGADAYELDESTDEK